MSTSFRRYITAVALIALGALVLGACDWTQFRYGPARTGFNPTETTISAANVGTLVEAWSGAVVGGSVVSGPVVANGVAYVGSYDGSPNGKLNAFDAAGATGCSAAPKTCSPLWTATTGGAIYSSPAVANGVVYVGSGDSSYGQNTWLYAFDAAGITNCSGTPKTCTPLWTAPTDGTLRSSPAVADGVVYIQSLSGRLYAFDAAGITNCSGTPKTCTPLWTAYLGGYPADSPSVANGVVYASAFWILFAFDAAGVTNCSGTPKTCTPLWTAPTEGLMNSTAAVANGVVYVSSGFGRLHAFDAGGVTNCSGTPKTCAPLWTGRSGYYSGSPAVANGVVYVSDGSVQAFDAAGVTNCSGTPKTCSPLWIGTVSLGRLDPWPMVANGVVYVGGVSGHTFYAFDAAGTTGCSGVPKTCAPLGTGPSGAPSVSPVVANGVVYSSGYNLERSGYDLKAYKLP